MRRKLNRSPEEMARREKISEMLQALDISSMDDIKELYSQTLLIRLSARRRRLMWVSFMILMR